MKQYTTAADAIADMHERGFTDDFQLFGNDLLWIQQKAFIPSRLFAIVEYHRLWHPASPDMNLLLFGIIAPHDNVGGILFTDAVTQSGRYPPVIIKKMNELNQSIVYGGNIENGWL